MSQPTTPNDSGLPVFSTKRATSEGAEKWLYQQVPVLDHGHVALVDYMGNDLSIDEAARISYGQGTRRISDATNLIRYLMRHAHTSPFEMIVTKWGLRMPIFVARQWVRHRTVAMNEESARYSEMRDTFYIPAEENISLQSTTNRQGGGERADDSVSQKVQELLRMDARMAYQHYTDMLDIGVAREQARINLPVGLYTEMYWQINLHNLFHFFNLRLDSHAQWEIRQFSEAMANIVAESFPIAWQAFTDYQLMAEKFTLPEMEVLRSLGQIVSLSSVARGMSRVVLRNQRERWECLEKLAASELIQPGQSDEVESYLSELSLSGKKAEEESKKLAELGLIA